MDIAPTVLPARVTETGKIIAQVALQDNNNQR